MLRLGMPSERVQAVLGAVGANVRRHREGRLTQEQLAEAAGLDQRTIQRLERGAMNISVGRLVAIADALGVDVVALFQPAVPNPARVGRPPKKPT